MNTLTEIQKAYIAGFVDGEGSISLLKRKNIECHTWQYCFRIQINVTNTFKAVLDEMQAITGVGKVYLHSRGTEKNRTCYRWQVRGLKARSLLWEIIPYLRVKKHQAEIALNFPYYEGIKKRTKGEYVEQIRMFLQIRDLNKRGPRIQTSER